MIRDDESIRWRLALLAGGDSPEREVSLASGLRATAALRSAGHAVESFDPAKVSIEAIAWHEFDACFIALHGGEGEDGRLQRRLERLAVAYTGSGPEASRRAMDKAEAKRRFRGSGVPTPDWAEFDARGSSQHAACNVGQLGYPLVVKPNSQGSSLGVAVVRSAAELTEAVAVALRYDDRVLLERYVAGRELTVALLGRTVFPVLEIIPPAETFDYHAKYHSSETQVRFVADLPRTVLDDVHREAFTAAAALGTRGLVRVDVMLDRTGQPWVLEVNTVPGLTDHSLAPRAAEQAGYPPAELCEAMVRDCLTSVEVGR